MSADLIVALVAAIFAGALATSKLVRTMFLVIFRHPLTKTRIEIHDRDKKDITVKVA